MQLPTISPADIKSKTDFLKFVLNAKRTTQDWRNLGCSLCEFILSCVDESTIDPNDDSTLISVVDAITNPLNLTIATTAWAETDEKIAWELYLMQMAIQCENRQNDGETMSAFGEGLMNTLSAKWPRLTEL